MLSGWKEARSHRCAVQSKRFSIKNPPVRSQWALLSQAKNVGPSIHCAWIQMFFLRYEAYYLNQETGRAKKVVDDRTRRITRGSEGELQFNHWRTSLIDKISRKEILSSATEGTLSFAEGNRKLFWARFSILVVQEYLGNIPDISMGTRDLEKLVKYAILILACLNAFIETSVTCLREGGT